jgi:hypothetical protein
MEKDRFRDEFKGEIVEKTIIFTTPEIAEGREGTYDVADNEYMGRRVRKTWQRGSNSLEILRSFLHEEFEGRSHFYIKVNANDFSECFNTAAKALLKFHSPGEVGKHIWANVTGGINILNLALTQVAYLSGFIPVLYYTFVANLERDGKYLRPFSRKEDEFDFRRIWVPKTKFDERTIYIYEELNHSGDIEDLDLLKRLKGKYEQFRMMDLQTFRRDFLNIMHGIGRKENYNYLTKDGKEILNLLSSPLIKALTRLERYPREKLEKLYRDLKLEEL